MVTDGRIARVDVTDNSKITTLSGAKIGDSESKIKSLYPKQIRVEAHEYDPKGHYLIISRVNSPPLGAYEKSKKELQYPAACGGVVYSLSLKIARIKITALFLKRMEKKSLPGDRENYQRCNSSKAVPNNKNSHPY